MRHLMYTLVFSVWSVLGLMAQNPCTPWEKLTEKGPESKLYVQFCTDEASQRTVFRVANDNDLTADVTLEFIFPDGTRMQRTVTVYAHCETEGNCMKCESNVAGVTQWNVKLIIFHNEKLSL